MLVHCKFTFEKRSLVLVCLRMHWVFRRTVILRGGPRDRRQRQKSWFLVPVHLTWLIWREHNKRTTQGNEERLHRLKSIVLSIWNIGTISPSSDQMVGFLDPLHG